jgi:hypothetical protein
LKPGDLLSGCLQQSIRVFREGLLEAVIYKQTPIKKKGANHEKIWRKIIPEKEKS